ncbi:MAG: hypothetical protein QOD06_1418 [Candidatus Binatota bacterium]|jgi:hypothetical protein|nr:hypothetical protein [Candidatus Binatota bacterium]
MPILDARHDFAHPVESDGAWSESYYFNAYDPQADVGFFSRLAIRPHEGTIDAFCFVWLPGGGIARLHAARPQSEMIDVGLEVGGIGYQRVTPLSEWRLRFRGDATEAEGGEAIPFDADVTFRALTPAIGVSGEEPSKAGATADAQANVAKGHFEQAGTWTGDIGLGDRRLTLTAARGNRDKSWGPRRWGGASMWRWFSINLGDDVHLGGIRLGTTAGDLHRGWLWKDGKASSIRRWDVKTELDPDGITQRRIRLTATDKQGRDHVLDAEVQRVAPLLDHPQGTSEGRTLVLEALARWRYDGRVGHGIAEYCHQLDEHGRPLVAIE